MTDELVTFRFINPPGLPELPFFARAKYHGFR
jgi:hypothetical protein